MVKRVVSLLVGTLLLAGLLGCVSAGAYRIKEQEAQSLSSANEVMQERNKWLQAENTKLETRLGMTEKEKEGLGEWLKKQREEIRNLQNRVESLDKDGDELRARIEKLKAKIAELDTENQRLAGLSRPENLLRSLGERLAELQKQAGVLAGENEMLKNMLASGLSEKKISGRAESDTAEKSTGWKPHAVAVSTGQNTAKNVPADIETSNAGDRIVTDQSAAQ